MEPIYPMSTLQRNPSRVKEDARDQVVRITEQGGGAYVFCSEEAFEARVAREREDAAYEARAIESVGRGIADIDAGRFFGSVDEAFEAAEEIRERRA